VESSLPPHGVAAQLDYFLGGENPCVLHSYTPPSLPAIVPNAYPDYTLSVLELPTSLEICFVGFSSSPDAGPLLTEIVSPSGHVVLSYTFTSEDIKTSETLGVQPAYFYSPIPGNEKGRYTVNAKQGAVEETWTFDVKPASTPTMLGMYGGTYDNSQNLPGVRPEHHFRTGEVVRVAFGGFAPNENVALRFYGPQPVEEYRPKIDYFGSLPFRLNAVGEGILEFKVPKNFPRGCYRVHNEKVSEESYPVQFCAV
jgi:hypothetical protein